VKIKRYEACYKAVLEALSSEEEESRDTKFIKK